MGDSMENTDPQLEHASILSLPPARFRWSGWDLIVGSFGVLLWLVVGWLVAISIPRGARLFAEFHMAVPLFTQIVTRFGQMAVPTIAVLTLLMCLKVRKRWAWFWLLMVLPAFIICGVFVSLYFPITRLLGALGGNAGWWEHF
jgi:hypothetical protein